MRRVIFSVIDFKVWGRDCYAMVLIDNVLRKAIITEPVRAVQHGPIHYDEPIHSCMVRVDKGGSYGEKQIIGKWQVVKAWSKPPFQFVWRRTERRALAGLEDCDMQNQDQTEGTRSA